MNIFMTWCAIGLGLSAVGLMLLVHSLFYAGFFEDPLTWGVLAVAGAVLAGAAASGQQEEAQAH